MTSPQRLFEALRRGDPDQLMDALAVILDEFRRRGLQLDGNRLLAVCPFLRSRVERAEDALELYVLDAQRVREEKKAKRIRKLESEGGAKGYQRNPTAQQQAKNNKARVERAAQGGATMSEAARDLGINRKTVSKYWPK